MRSFQYKTFVDVPFGDIPFDELGAAGWELVAAVPSMLGGMTKYIFKKSIVDEVIMGDHGPRIPNWPDPEWYWPTKVTC